MLKWSVTRTTIRAVIQDRRVDFQASGHLPDGTEVILTIDANRMLAP